MDRFSRKQIAVASLIVLFALGGGGLLYARRSKPVNLAAYVPETALGYLEINDWNGAVDRLSSTEAWRRMAPAYGVPDISNYAGWAGRLSGLTGLGEAGALAGAQFAVVVTELEVRGDEVKPRLALIVETRGGSSELRSIIEARLPWLAEKAFGPAVRETSEYGGAPITTYRPDDKSDRKLLSTQIESEWILANHTDALRACIDARLGRRPSMANNFYLQNARPIVDRGGEIFGFVTGEGVTRLTRFGAFLISNAALRETGVVETLQDVLSDLTSRASDGVAYGAGIENGEVVDRYSLLFKPDLIESLKPLIKSSPVKPRSQDYIPPGFKDATVFRIENPGKTLDGIEAAISARIGAGQSFLLHQFLLGAREIFLGSKSADDDQRAIGDEIANFSFADKPQDRIWMIAVRDRAAMNAIVARYFNRDGATIRKESYGDAEILSSTDPRKSSAAFIGDFLALGARDQLARLIDIRRLGAKFGGAKVDKFREAVITSFGSVRDESAEMMTTIAKWTGGGANPQAAEAAASLPYSTSATSLNERGIYTESRSPFGNFPFFVSIISGVIDHTP